MLIIGEKLNSAIPSVRQIINDKDVAAVQNLALKQVEGGANYLDLNTAQCNEDADMEWLIQNVQEVTDIPLCIDSISAQTVERGLTCIKGDKSKVMINSISLEKDRIEGILPLVIKHQCPVIGLTTDDNGIPKTAEQRIAITKRLIEVLSKENYDLNKLYIDPLVLPLAVDSNNATMFFQCLTDIKRLFNVKTVSGLSNISYTMPKRKIINRHFLAICMAFGMDAAILDPIDRKIMTSVTAANLLIGQDKFGRNYLKAFRNETLED
ncbi:MAG: methyltetrahydrofolate:corrinoid methyltransferase [Peptococcaceae bacterium BICA1-8]|nr:MAG: methyltetrahydrofolate:corrinoid methyltransferase [Peptococcaceae bacterium BICA1-8]